MSANTLHYGRAESKSNPQPANLPTDNIGPGTLQFNDDNVWKQDDISPGLMVYF